MRRDLLPFAIVLLALVMLFRITMRRRGNARLRPQQMDVFRRLTRTRFMVSSAYAGDRGELTSALDEAGRLFRDSRVAKPALDELRELMRRSGADDTAVENQMTRTLQAMARELRVDADFLEQSIRPV